MSFCVPKDYDPCPENPRCPHFGTVHVEEEGQFHCTVPECLCGTENEEEIS